MNVGRSERGPNDTLVYQMCGSAVLKILFLLGCLSDSQKGVYGDVQRVKILYNKKDSALIQMADGNQSQLGETSFSSFSRRF